EAPEAVFARWSDPLRSPVNACGGTARARDQPELGCYQHRLSASANGATHELLVRALAVHVRGIHVGDAEIEGAMDRAHRLLVGARAVDLRHPHATKADRRHCQSARSELALFHHSSVRQWSLHVAMC